MENQNFEKERLVFLEQYHNLFRNRMYPDALALAEERLKKLPSDVDAYAAIGETLIALDLMDEAREIVLTVEKKISAMTLVLTRLGNLFAQKGYEKDSQLCFQKFMVLRPSFHGIQESIPDAKIQQGIQETQSKTTARDKDSSSENVSHTLSEWLKNIRRIKTHATVKK
ncbi:MAG: tetratricopeptide repeat protein [Smithellaceae bacterium]|jgi:tetratricopeptide (TPR) repeat protein|nr:tetratricopeptide repeat protein [Smithellaceae bacterium]